MRMRLLLLAWLLLSLYSGLAMAATAATPPNVVLLLIDDGGFSDLGAYGGEARTPNIDSLAAKGAMFSQYHTSPLCSPSRAMLLTGIDNHQNGVATIRETIPKAQENRKGYSLHLEAGADTVAKRLKSVGYRTYMTGKWHLGSDKADLPNAHGFDRSFVLDASGADNWEQKPYMPYYDRADWFEDGQPATLPEDFYSSKFLIDQMLNYIGPQPQQPFLAYVAFQAVHIPVQAPKEFTQHYLETYKQGWEATRTARWQKAQGLGLIPTGAPLAAAHPDLRAWGSLSLEEQALYAKSMAVHAGMLEAMDFHIGRLIQHLKDTGQFENTVFVVTSDNGPEPSNPMAQPAYRLWMKTHGYDHTLDTLGEKGSLVFIGPEWANATASPGNLFKFHASEGGMRVPLIISGAGIPAGRTIGSKSFVTDIAPTLYDTIGLPPAQWNGAVPMTGQSLKAVLQGEKTETYAANTPIGMEVGGNAALFKGDHKLVKSTLPWSDGAWRLYNLKTDPNETQDLSQSQPARYQELRADYRAYEKAKGVLPLPQDFNPHQQVRINAYKKEAYRYRFYLLGLVLIVFGGLFAVVRRRNR